MRFHFLRPRERGTLPHTMALLLAFLRSGANEMDDWLLRGILIVFGLAFASPVLLVWYEVKVGQRSRSESRVDRLKPRFGLRTLFWLTAAVAAFTASLLDPRVGLAVVGLLGLALAVATWRTMLEDFRGARRSRERVRPQFGIRWFFALTTAVAAIIAANFDLRVGLALGSLIGLALAVMTVRTMLEDFRGTRRARQLLKAPIEIGLPPTDAEQESANGESEEHDKPKGKWWLKRAAPMRLGRYGIWG